MIGKLLATTAVLLVITGAAYAQNTASGGMLASGYQMTSTDALASKLIGSDVYSTMAANNGNAANSATTTTATTTTGSTSNGSTAANANGAPANNAGDTNAQKIGTVRDLVLASDGKIAAVVIGIGGVLGVGEKNVAVAYPDVHWAVAQDGSIRGTLDTTADALKAAPDFVYPANNQASNGNANTTSTTTTPAPAMSNANNNNGGINLASLKPTSPDAIKADDLKGIDVLDHSGQKIASISDFVLTKDGKVDAVIIDFGGFLGIGSKQIALAFEGLKFMDDNSGKHYLVVNLTKDQLNAQRAYNKDDYPANRAAERLKAE